MEQVFAEGALPDTIFEILVGRGNHANAAAHRVVAADAVVLPVGKHAQQSRLQVERHVTDFVEKQRTAIGLLEAATACGLRAGERSALVTEKFGFEQILGNRGSVDRDERPLCARAVLVQRVGHQLLARARLPGDQHRDDALAQAADRAKHILHRRCLTEHFRHLSRLFVPHLFAEAFLDRTANQLDCLGHIEGFRQVFERAALEGADGAV